MDLSNKEMVHIKSGKIQYLQFRRLLEYSDILTHAYSVGIDKNFRTSIEKNEEYEKSVSNYNELCRELNIDSTNLVKTGQKHSEKVKIVDRKFKLNEPDFNIDEYVGVDGLITKKKNIILSTTNADCILLLLFDPNKKVIANVHSGWKGTLQRIAINAVNKMYKEYGCDPKDIIVCICPSIRRCHFEVEKDVMDLFFNEFQDINISRVIEEKVQNKKWNIDTLEINKMILQNAGIKEENIVDSGICSVCNSDMIHSYRVEKQKYMLNTAIIGLKL